MNTVSRGVAALRVKLAGLALGLLLACGATQAQAVAVAPSSSASFTQPFVFPFGPPFAFVVLNGPVKFKLQYDFVAPAGMEFDSASGIIDWGDGSANATFALGAISGLKTLTHTFGTPAVYNVAADLTVNWLFAGSSGVGLSFAPGSSEHVFANVAVLPILPTPIPASLVMLGTALASLGILGWRRRSSLAPTV